MSKPITNKAAMITAVQKILEAATAPMSATEIYHQVTGDRFKKLGKVKFRQLVQNTLDHFARKTVGTVVVTQRPKKTGRLINVYAIAEAPEPVNETGPVEAALDAAIEATENAADLASEPSEEPEVEEPAEAMEETEVREVEPINTEDYAKQILEASDIA